MVHLSNLYVYFTFKESLTLIRRTENFNFPTFAALGKLLAHFFLWSIFNLQPIS